MTIILIDEIKRCPLRTRVIASDILALHHDYMRREYPIQILNRKLPVAVANIETITQQMSIAGHSLVHVETDYSLTRVNKSAVEDVRPHKSWGFKHRGHAIIHFQDGNILHAREPHEVLAERFFGLSKPTP